MNKEEILKLLYVNKDYSGIKELLKNSSDVRSFNMLGKIELQTGNIEEAKYWFEKSKSLYAQSYCRFITSDLDGAKAMLNLIPDFSSASKWLLCLIGLIKNETEEYPTYFQIRNFYEQDLEMLFLYNKTDYIRIILNKNNYLEKFNTEIYKYSARVLLNNKRREAAKSMLKKSLDIFYKDPETHYMLGEIYEAENNIILAKDEYRKCVEVTGEYIPARKKLKKLSN